MAFPHVLVPNYSLADQPSVTTFSRTHRACLSASDEGRGVSSSPLEGQNHRQRPIIYSASGAAGRCPIVSRIHQLEMTSCPRSWLRAIPLRILQTRCHYPIFFLQPLTSSSVCPSRSLIVSCYRSAFIVSLSDFYCDNE